LSADEEDKTHAEEKTPEQKDQEGEQRKPVDREVKRKYLKFAEFGLPESPYETIRSIIRAMGKLGGAGTQLNNQQISQTAALGERAVSINNRFLLSTGVANKSGNSISLTEKGSQLALALDYNDTEEIARVWRSIAAENEFFKRIMGALDIKGGMTIEELSLNIAKNAGAPNEPQYVRGGQTVAEVLLESGLVTESESGKLVVTPQYRTIGAEAPSEIGAPPEARKPESVLIERAKDIPLQKGSTVVVNINVSVSAEMTDEDLDRLSSRIKGLRDRVQ